MAYKIVAQPKVWWPVTFKGATEDGAVVENVFEMRFRILDEDENSQLDRDITKVREADDINDRSLSDVMCPIVLRMAEDWRGVTEDDGTEGGASLVFNEENLKRMLRVPNVTAAIARAYRAARAGEPDRRAGN